MSKVTILGSFVVDLITRTQFLPQKGHTIFATDFDMGAGGKGQTQAVQSHLMGCKTEFICKLGKDELSNIGKNFWESIGFFPKYHESLTSKTGCANISVDFAGQNQIAVYLGANNTFTEDEIKQSLKKIKDSNIFLTQSETNIDAIDLAIDICFKENVPIVYNPAPFRILDNNFLKKLFLITPNESEAAGLLGLDKINTKNCIDAGKQICAMGPKNCIITLGENGCCFVSKDIAKIYPTIKVKAIDTVGAGDSFNGALVAMLAMNYSMEESIKYALAASSLSVLSKGSAISMKTISEVTEFRREKQF